jgi:predicted Zn-dependent peptidase
MKTQKTVLDNGLTLITENNEHAVSTLLCYWVKAGGHYEAEHPYGTAHFLEHMMFKGTAQRTKYEIAEEMDEIGGRFNGATGGDQTHYHILTPYDQWKKGLDLLTDMVFHSVLPEHEISLERKVILEEIKRAEDNVEMFGGRMLFRRLRVLNPERASNLGTPESVSAMTRADLIRFKEQYYSPDNITLVVTGRIHHQELVEYVQTLAIPAFSSVAVNLEGLTESPLRGETIEVSRVMKQAHLHWGMYGPRANSVDVGIGHVIAALIGGCYSSRLKKLIRQDNGLAYTVNAGVSPMPTEGFIYGFVAVDPANIAEVKRIIVEQLELLKEELVSEQELQKVKKSLVGKYLISEDNMTSRNARLAYEHHQGVSSELADYVDNIEQVTVEAIQQFACRYFGEDKMVFIQLSNLA